MQKKLESAGESGVNLPAHSPGPWQVIDRHICDADGNILLSTKYPSDEANLALAAAAPELRDALETLVQSFEDPVSSIHPILAKARAALAKATKGNQNEQP